MHLIRSLKTAYAVISVLVMLAGAALMLRPAASAALICTILGVVSIVYGVIRLAGYFSNDLYRLAFQFDLAVGILGILLGLALLLRPQDVLTGLPVVVGAFVLVDGVLRLQTAMDAKHFGMRKWWLVLVSAVCCALLGLLLILRPFPGGMLLVRCMGAALLCNGAENLVAALCTVRVPRRSAADVIDSTCTFPDE